MNATYKRRTHCSQAKNLIERDKEQQDPKMTVTAKICLKPTTEIWAI